ncbi:MAG TPA: response regulator transcription factor [Candidatus Eisenbacteria bacterium]|nr:response regulator transcription factor [Candidatus Eisenbacteria bacterium]
MKRKILIVDDEADILASLTTRLTSAGYEVSSAADGAEAVRLALEIRPDLILMDIKLPLMDGIEACRRIKTATVDNPIPVIFLTADASIRFTHEKHPLSADGYLIKPFLAEALLGLLRAHL